MPRLRSQPRNTGRGKSISPSYTKEDQLRYAPGKRKNKELITKDPKHNKQRSQAQEREIAKQYKDAGFDKSRRQPMSGALHGAALFADVDPGALFLIEAKQTRSGKLVLETEWLKKIKDEAESQNRRPLLHAAIALDEGQYERWVAMPEEDWMKIVKENKDLDSENKFLRTEGDK